MKLLLLSLIVSLQLLHGTVSIKERFAQAKPGDYIVTEQNKIYSLITISDRIGDRLILEEYALPASLKKNLTWKEWYATGANGATSHILYEFDLANERLLRCYSPSRKSYLEPDSIFLTLLTIPLKEVHLADRKRIGPTPTDGIDMRKIWSPPLFVEGKKMAHPQFGVMRADWPQDETPLSRRQIDLYFDDARPDFPFPCWIEIGDGNNTYKLRCVDTGSHLTPHHQNLPFLPPAFMPEVKSTNESITLTLDRDCLSGQLHLFAEDLDSSPQKTWLIPFELQGCDLVISKCNIKRLFTQGHRYRWFAMFDGQSGITAEHPSPFLFSLETLKN